VRNSHKNNHRLGGKLEKKMWELPDDEEELPPWEKAGHHWDKVHEKRERIERIAKSKYDAEHWSKEDPAWEDLSFDEQEKYREMVG
jgi:hypothetical protein